MDLYEKNGKISVDIDGESQIHHGTRNPTCRRIWRSMYRQAFLYVHFCRYPAIDIHASPNIHAWLHIYSYLLIYIHIYLYPFIFRHLSRSRCTYIDIRLHIYPIHICKSIFLDIAPCMRISSDIYTHRCRSTSTRIPPFLSIYTYWQIHIHIYPYLSICIHLDAYILISVHIYTYICRSIHTILSLTRQIYI